MPHAYKSVSLARATWLAEQFLLRIFRQYFGAFKFSLSYFWFWKQSNVDVKFASFERRVNRLSL